MDKDRLNLIAAKAVFVHINDHDWMNASSAEDEKYIISFSNPAIRYKASVSNPKGGVNNIKFTVKVGDYIKELTLDEAKSILENHNIRAFVDTDDGTGILVKVNQDDCRHIMKQVIAEHLIRNVYINNIPKLAIDKCDHITYMIHLEVKDHPELTKAKVEITNSAGIIGDDKEFLAQMHFLDENDSMFSAGYTEIITYKEAIDAKESILLLKIE